MNLWRRFLLRIISRKEIGWESIGEKFTRYQLVKCRWGNVYLHRLNAPNWHPECHSHPWNFLTVLLWRGYFEQVGPKVHRRWPGMILWRPATFQHNVITIGTAWSVIFTGPKCRDWGFHACGESDALSMNT